MEEKSVHKHFSRFLLSITFDEDNLDVIKKNISNQKLYSNTDKNDPVQVWNAFDDSKINTFFLPHFRHFLSANAPDNYVYRWKMSKEAMSFLFSFMGKNDILKADIHKLSEKFKIIDIELYLFRSGVGILIIETKILKPQGPLQLVHFNYYMRYIGKYSAKLVFQPNIGERLHPEMEKSLNNKINEYINQYKIEDNKIPEVFYKLHHYNIKDSQLIFSDEITFSELILGILQFVFQDKVAYDFTHDQDNVSFDILTGERLILYSYLFNDPLGNDDRLKFVHMLSRVDKESEQTSIGDLDPGHTRIKQIYENIFFGVSLEGATVLVEDNKVQYIEDEFERTIKGGYFLIFLISLHNRLALLNYRHKISKIMPGEISNIINKKLLNQIRTLKNKSVSRYINSYFAQIANNTAFEEIYHFYNENLYIDSLSNEIRNKTIELDEIVNLEIERMNNQMSVKEE